MQVNIPYMDGMGIASMGLVHLTLELNHSHGSVTGYQVPLIRFFPQCRHGENRFASLSIEANLLKSKYTSLFNVDGNQKSGSNSPVEVGSLLVGS